MKMCGKSARQLLVTAVGGKPWVLKCHIQESLRAARSCFYLVETGSGVGRNRWAVMFIADKW